MARPVSLRNEMDETRDIKREQRDGKVLPSIDARAKIAVLTVYSICIFFADTWVGIAIFFLLAIVVCAACKSPVSTAMKLGTIVYVIAALTIFFNTFSFSPEGFYPTLNGFIRGCFFAARIVLLVMVSLFVCLSSDPQELSSAFRSYLSPLAKLKVPVDDISTILSIALRFIPMTASEYFAIRDAQWARGAKFDEGGVFQIIKAHCAILVPLFINMFRRADVLAMSMDSRGYGITGVRRIDINSRRIDGVSIVFSIVVCSAAIVFAVVA